MADVVEISRVLQFLVRTGGTNSTGGHWQYQVPFANIGLPLQPRFRTVRTIKRSEDALGGVSLRLHDGYTGWWFGTAMWPKRTSRVVVPH